MFGRLPKLSLKPPPIAAATGAAEVLRAWILPGWTKMQVTLQPRHDDPAVWGMLLVDVARHAAKAYALESRYSESEALRRIKQVFDAEWATPTDLAEGFTRE